MIKECGVFNEEERLIAAFKSPQFIRLVIDNTAVFIDSEEIRIIDGAKGRIIPLNIKENIRC